MMGRAKEVRPFYLLKRGTIATRKQNEKNFDHWDELPDGGRRYWFDRTGAVWGIQRIIKIVDANEKTLFLIQEIYNDDGELYERHQKFPTDTGHEIIKKRGEE